MADMDTYDSEQRGYEGMQPRRYQQSNNPNLAPLGGAGRSQQRWSPRYTNGYASQHGMDSIDEQPAYFNSGAQIDGGDDPVYSHPPSPLPSASLGAVANETIITSIEDGTNQHESLTPTRSDDRERERGYDRERSRSPANGDRDLDRDGDARIRDEPINGRGGRERDDRGPPPDRNDSEDVSVNPGSNLFVTGIHPRLTEDEVSRLFEKYGEVEKCNIMRDPHTRESRGFGFVKMVTSDTADAAKDALQGEVYEGRTLSIEKARRAKPRTPTPGKYFGPPKRDDPPRRGGMGGYRDRYDDRGYGGGRRDDYRSGGRGGGYRDRYDDRGYGGGRRDDSYQPRVDRYAGGDRGGDRYERRGGGGGGSYGGGYDRRGDGPPARAAYGADPVAGDAPPARNYDRAPRSYD